MLIVETFPLALITCLAQFIIVIGTWKWSKYPGKYEFQREGILQSRLWPYTASVRSPCCCCWEKCDHGYIYIYIYIYIYKYIFIYINLYKVDMYYYKQWRRRKREQENRYKKRRTEWQKLTRMVSIRLRSSSICFFVASNALEEEIEQTQKQKGFVNERFPMVEENGVFPTAVAPRYRASSAHVGAWAVAACVSVE